MRNVYKKYIQYPQLENQSINTRRLELYEGLAPDLDLPKEKNGFFMRFFFFFLLVWGAALP